MVFAQRLLRVGAKHTSQIPSQRHLHLCLSELQQPGPRALEPIWAYAQDPRHWGWCIWPGLGSKGASGGCRHGNRGSDEGPPTPRLKAPPPQLPGPFSWLGEAALRVIRWGRPGPAGPLRPQEGTQGGLSGEAPLRRVYQEIASSAKWGHPLARGLAGWPVRDGGDPSEEGRAEGLEGASPPRPGRGEELAGTLGVFLRVRRLRMEPREIALERRACSKGGGKGQVPSPWGAGGQG